MEYSTIELSPINQIISSINGISDERINYLKNIFIEALEDYGIENVETIKSILNECIETEKDDFKSN